MVLEKSRKKFTIYITQLNDLHYNCLVEVLIRLVNKIYPGYKNIEIKRVLLRLINQLHKIALS